jgi:hypothetical protein
VVGWPGWSRRAGEIDYLEDEPLELADQALCPAMQLKSRALRRRAVRRSLKRGAAMVA